MTSGKEQSCDLCGGDLEGLQSEHSGVCSDCVSNVDAELSEAIVRRSKVVTEDGNPAIEIPGGARIELRTVVNEWDYDHPNYGADVPMRTEVDADDSAWWTLYPKRSDSVTGRESFPEVVIEPTLHAPEDDEERPELRTDGGTEQTGTEQRVPSSEDYCKLCGSEETIPVWEDPEDFEKGAAPDYVGCLSCNEMRALEDDDGLCTDGGEPQETDSEQLGELAAEVEEAIRDLRVQTRLLDDTASVADLQDIMWDLQDALPESFEESEDGDDRLITDGGTDSTGTERILDEGERARQVARGDYGDTELEAKIHGPSVTDDEYNESLKLMKVHQGEGSLAGWTKLSLPTDVERVEEFIGVLEDARDELAYLKQAQERPQPGDRDE